MLRMTAIAAIMIPSVALAVGSNTDTQPTQTNTTAECTNGQVWDEKTQECVDAQDSRLDDDTRYDAVRELAYDGQYDNARKVLAAMSDQHDTRVLTYRGFISRKTGDTERAFEYYEQAIAADPNNILARSYYGQGLVAAGKTAAAARQLWEIRNRGGAGGWAEQALNDALKTGGSSDY